jgi:prepilin-type processing-associated H-X9-DG protein
VSYGYNPYGLSTRGTSLALGGQNVWLGGTDGAAPPVRDSEVVSPGQLILLGDGFKGGKGIIEDGLDVLSRNDVVQDYLGSTVRALARHQKKANFVFSDGHVEAPTLKFFFEDNTDAALAHWNRHDWQSLRNFEKVVPLCSLKCGPRADPLKNKGCSTAC